MLSHSESMELLAEYGRGADWTKLDRAHETARLFMPQIEEEIGESVEKIVATQMDSF